MRYVEDFGLLSSCGDSDRRILVWPERDEWSKVKRFNAKGADGPPPRLANPRMELRRPSDDEWKRALGVEVDAPSAENGYGADSVHLRPEVPKGWSSECRTEVVWMNLNPVYQETLDLDLTGGPNEDSCKLLVELYDRDLTSADDLLGVVELDFAEIKNGDHAYVTSYQVEAAPDNTYDYNLEDTAIYMSIKYVVRESSRPEPVEYKGPKSKEGQGSCTCTYDYRVKRPEGEDDDWIIVAGYTDGRCYAR